MGELVRVGRADSFCLMNRFQACIWVRTKTGSPSSLALFFILGGGKTRDVGYPEPTMALIILQMHREG